MASFFGKGTKSNDTNNMDSYFLNSFHEIMGFQGSPYTTTNPLIQKQFRKTLATSYKFGNTFFSEANTTALQNAIKSRTGGIIIARTILVQYMTEYARIYYYKNGGQEPKNATQSSVMRDIQTYNQYVIDKAVPILLQQKTQKIEYAQKIMNPAPTPKSNFAATVTSVRQTQRGLQTNMNPTSNKRYIIAQSINAHKLPNYVSPFTQSM